MRDATPGIIAHLNTSTTFEMIDFYDFDLLDGTQLRYSGVQLEHDHTLGPKFERSRIRTVIGTEVDALELNIYPEPTDMIGTFTFIEAAWNGVFDGAVFQLNRAFLGTTGAVALFAGKVSDIECRRTSITMRIRSYLELLNNQMPRRLFQSPCGHIFGGAMCQFDRSTMDQTFACGVGSTQESIVTAITPTPSTLFNMGSIVGVTGQNALHTRSIVILQGGAFQLRLPFLYPVVVGDQFNALPGCDKILATCRDVFSNEEHYGGFPHIPTAETGI